MHLDTTKIIQAPACIFVGYYMYIEATGHRTNETAEIASAKYPAATRGHCFSLWYHMYGSHIGSLNVFKEIKNKKYFLWGMNGDRGNVWKKTQITIRSNAEYKVGRMFLSLFGIAVCLQSKGLVYLELQSLCSVKIMSF